MSHSKWHQFNRCALQIVGWLSIFTLGDSPVWGQILSTGATFTTTDGYQIQVIGGVQSTDGANLFHQFETFHILPDQTVTFIAPESVENVLGRITGGQASIIHGGLAVSNSANLWLLNPAGLFFGPNAHLNLQGDFTAATADAIGFEQGWFADGTDYQALAGPPQSFAFVSNPNYIINLGTLEVAPGRNLRLLGGGVVNTGTLSAPGGNITITAVSNTNRVNLSQTGQLLALEIEPWSDAEASLDITPTQLPALLTGQGADHADTLAIAADGTPLLTQHIPALEPGTASISGTVQTTGDYGGQIAILGNQVSLIDADINADGIHQGGEISIGGSYQGAGPLPNATHTRVDQNTQLSANALAHGNGGEIIVWADQATSFAGNVQAQGGELAGNGGFIEISGKSNLGFTGQFSVSAPQGEFGSILFDPDNIQVVDGAGTANGDAELLLNSGTVIAEDGDSGWFTITENTLETWDGDSNIVLQANNNIIIRNLGGDDALTFQPGSGSISFIADADNNGAGQFLVEKAGDLIDTSGRDITISGNIIDIQLLDTRAAMEAGDVNLSAQYWTLVRGTLTADNIILQGDAISLQGGNDSVKGNTLSLQPWSQNQAIEIGSSVGSPALDLLETDLLAIQDGFTNISIGRTDHTGTITLHDSVADGGSAAFKDPVTILGAETLQGPEQVTTWTITGNNQGNLDTIFSNGLSFEDVSSIVASNNTSDILQGTEGNDTITLLGENSGTFKGIDFDGIHNIRGAGGDDTVIFANGVAALSGSIDGGDGNNTLDYSATTNGVTIDLATQTVDNVTAFTNIENFQGSSGEDTLRGTNDDDAIAITADNTGTLGTVTFSNIENIDAGDGDDQIAITGILTGSLDGGAGDNTLVGNNTASVWNLTAVNTGNGPGVASFANIQNLTAGNQADQINFLAEGAQFTGVLDGGDGALTLSGDTINVGTAIKGADELSLQPASPARDIHLGGTGLTPDLAISTVELSAIKNGFTAITIGHPEGTGTITLGADVTLPASATIQSPHDNGSIDTQGFDLSAPELTVIAAQDITAANLTAVNGVTLIGGDVVNTQTIVTSNNLDGGDVLVNADNTITIQQIDTTGLNGIGGNVTLSSVEAIEVASIRAEGNMAGGNVDITTHEFFRATDSFTALDGTTASISTAAVNGTGAITIRHAGNGATAFNVGDGSLLGNHAALTSGDFKIDPGNSFLNSYTLGNIAILTQALPQSVVEPPVTIPSRPTIITPTATDPFIPNSPLLRNRTNPLDDSVSATDVRRSNSALFEHLENSFSDQFKSHLNLYDRVSVASPSLTAAQETLGDVEVLTGIKPGVLYVYFLPSDPKDSTEFHGNDLQANDELGLLLLTHSGQAIRKKVNGVTRSQVMAVTETFYAQVTNSISSSSQYLPPAQQLYDWFITPIENELQQQGIQSLALAMDTGLRTLPMAALHNGDEYLVERYSLGVIPSFSLTDFNAENFLYSELENTQMLAMGASQFPSQSLLPAVPEELEIVTKVFNESEVFLNENFTLTNLQNQIARNKFGVVHLASHGVFEPGAPRNSYIQLWDQPLQLDQVHSLGLQDANIALMVLSACNTALGDREAEYGFAGLAVNAGVQTSIASLWPISDEGTLGLMTYFYENLQRQPVRANALQQAQLAMLRGELTFANGILYGYDERSLAHFPELEYHGWWNFEHPFYWATYTLVGSPW